MWDDLDPRSLDSRDRDASDPRDAEPIDPRDVFTQRPGPAARARARARPRARPRLPAARLRGADAGHGRRLSRRAGQTISATTADASADLRHGDLERLRTAGLIRVVAPSIARQRTAARDAHRPRPRRCSRAIGRATTSPRRRSTPASVKSRELVARRPGLPRLPAERRTAARATGARIRRVVLEHELKREYQRFLQEPNRGRSDSDGRPDRDRARRSRMGARARPADRR